VSRKKNTRSEKDKWLKKSAKRKSSDRSDGRRRQGRNKSDSDSPWGRAGKKPQPCWTGIVSAHPDGFGFVDVAERDKGIFIPREEMRDLMHGDKVEVRIVRRRGRESGEIVRIIEHAPSVIVAQLVMKQGVIMAEPRSRRMPQSILVRRQDTLDAHDGDWVRLNIQRGSNPPRGKVIEILGKNMQPEQLIDLIIAEQQLPESFPDAVLHEATQFAAEVKPEQWPQRTDLRHISFVTIDGADARDFDDAICVHARGEGFEAWVAIADVAEYVRTGTALDKEALARGNSFYFPDRVIPMLPESLSNGLCSINPHVPRLAMAVRLRFDANGICRSTRIYESIIESRARLTYSQASDWLEQRNENAVADAGIRHMLDDAMRLHHKLAKRRSLRGALDLDVPEVRAVLHEGRLSGMVPGERNIAHHLIEEMMLAANTTVAEWFERQQCPLLYRVHAAPEREAIESLNRFLAPFGVTIPLPRGKNKVKPGNVQDVLERSEGKVYGHVLHRLVLRSMQQAKYTPNNEGHFGLAYRHYCHFTSPIRRYADLTVHRRLKALLRKQNPDAVQSADTLAEIGEHVSVQERKQQRIEWDIQAMLAALYHQKDVGKTMQAVISGMSKRRIFVELADTLAEASLPLDALGHEFTLDESMHRLFAHHGQVSFGLGDTIEVSIDSTDPIRGLINVSLISARTPAPATR